MEFEDFLNVVRDRLPEFLLQYDIEDIHIEAVDKNNGTRFTGMAIIIKGEKLSPNVYMDYYYGLYSNGTDIEHILAMIADEYKKARGNLSSFNCDHIENMDILNHIFIRLINYEKNKKLLEDCPFVRYHDLAVCFRILVNMDENGISSAALGNRELEKLNMDIDSLYEHALENTRKLFPPVLQRMEDVLMEKLPGIGDISRDAKLFVLTNSRGINGAACMVYEDILENFAGEHGSFYILPSSIHEVLLFPSEEERARPDLEEMVSEVNQYVVSETEFLSDKVYFYDASMGQLLDE